MVGRISKHWSGILKEILTDVDTFGIQFPLDLDVKMKAVMLGACFLIVPTTKEPGYYIFKGTTCASKGIMIPSHNQKPAQSLFAQRTGMRHLSGSKTEKE